MPWTQNFNFLASRLTQNLKHYPPNFRRPQNYFVQQEEYRQEQEIIPCNHCEYNNLEREFESY